MDEIYVFLHSSSIYLLVICLLLFDVGTDISQAKRPNVKDDIWLIERISVGFFNPIQRPIDSFHEIQKHKDNKHSKLQFKFGCMKFHTIFNVIAIRLVCGTHFCSKRNERHTWTICSLFFYRNHQFNQCGIKSLKWCFHLQLSCSIWSNAKW